MSAAGLPPPSAVRRSSLARPNPFAFASDTTFRFVILVVLALGVTVFVWSWAWLNVEANSRFYQSHLERCAPLLHQQADDVDSALALSTGFNECMQTVNRQQAFAGVMGAALLLGTTGAVYWLLPLWRRRRRSLVRLETAGVAGLAEAIDDARRTAGVTERVDVVVDPLNPHVSALVFGRVGRRHVELHRGLLTLFRDDLPAFRAIVLHEFAHLRNRDVDVTYLTVATWRCFAAVTLVPLVATFVRQGWSFALNMGWRMLALILLVYLTRNAVLRSGELYADVRASSWSGAEALQRVLSQGPAEEFSRWRTLMSLHPPAAKRTETLTETAELLRVGFWEAFAAGLATTLAIGAVMTALNSLLGTTLSNYWLSGLVFVPLAVWIVGLGTWRSVFADVVTSTRTSVATAGVGLGLGFAFGRGLAPDAVLTSIPVGSFTFVLWTAFVVAVACLQVAWISASARAWSGAVMRRGSPGRVVLTNLVLASFMTAVWLPLLLALLDFSSFGTDRGTSAAVLMIVFGGLILAFGVSPAATLASIVTIWAYPLLGATRRQDGAVEAWVSLDRVDPAWSPAAPQVRVRSSVVMGVVVGLALVAVLLSLRLLLHAVVAEEVRNTDAWVLQFLLWSVLIATLLQVMASVPAALMARTLRALHGLLAAAVTGVFGVVGIVGGIGVGSCIPVFSVRPSQRCSFAVEPEFLWQVLHQVLRAGGLAALLIGLLIAAVARRDPPGRSAPTTQSRVVALDPDLETMQGQR